MPYLIRSSGTEVVTEAATANEAILAAEQVEAAALADVVITTPSGDSLPLSQFKIIVAGVRVESE